MANRINICISADDKFIELGAIALYSAVYYANPNTSFSFYIIDNGISVENRNRVLSLFNREDVSVEFINANDIEEELGMKINVGRWTLSAFQRLYISDFLPQDVHRVLYLDCDMLVRGQLDELYETDLEEKYVIAGALDCISEQNKINIGLTGKDFYINSGMLMIDIDRWKSFSVREKSAEYMKNNIKYLQFPDQDTINFILKNRIKIVPLKYNAHTVLFNYKYDEVLRYRNAKMFCDEEMYQEAITEPVIVHFTQDTISIRPWYVNGGHKFREEWLEIRNMTPWKNQPLWKDNRPFGIKIKYIGFRLLPRKIAVGLAAKVNNHHAMKNRH